MSSYLNRHRSRPSGDKLCTFEITVRYIVAGFIFESGRYSVNYGKKIASSLLTVKVFQIGLAPARYRQVRRQLG